jgi:hypothetical protein
VIWLLIFASVFFAFFAFLAIAAAGGSGRDSRLEEERDRDFARFTTDFHTDQDDDGYERLIPVRKDRD